MAVIRQQFKEGADFIKIYETGRDTLRNGVYNSIYQYTEAEMRTAVQEAARSGKRVAVHATGEPGTGYAAKAGVASVDHAYFLSDETMRIMRDKQIYAVPTFAIAECAPRRIEKSGATSRWTSTLRSSRSNWRRECRWQRARMWDRSRTARRPANM